MICRAYMLYKQLDGGLNALNYFHYTQSDYLSRKLTFRLQFHIVHLTGYKVCEDLY